MADDDSNGRSVISRKELARQLRQRAYRKAKEQRAKDPRYLAMKETVKQRRREMYQQVKERRKATLSEEKAVEKKRIEEKKAAERAAADSELMKMIRVTSKGSDAKN